MAQSRDGPRTADASRRGRARRDGAPLATAELIRIVVNTARARAPKALAPYHTLQHSWIGKLWTGNDDLHYEVWPRPRVSVLELGLHFEADALTNARLLAAFRAREREIRAALGDEPRIEPWDKGWARVYETHALQNEWTAAERYGARLAAYVIALEPILRDELPVDVRWSVRS